MTNCFILVHRPGSLVVVFDVDTDGQQTQEEIEKLIQEALNRGALGQYSVSPEGYEFRLVRTGRLFYSCLYL